jgi:hypothetical protein
MFGIGQWEVIFIVAILGLMCVAVFAGIVAAVVVASSGSRQREEKLP